MIGHEKRLHFLPKSCEPIAKFGNILGWNIIISKTTTKKFMNITWKTLDGFGPNPIARPALSRCFAMNNETLQPLKLCHQFLNFISNNPPECRAIQTVVQHWQSIGYRGFGHFCDLLQRGKLFFGMYAGKEETDPFYRGDELMIIGILRDVFTVFCRIRREELVRLHRKLSSLV